ncbi:outer membrane protein assembly factor BamD [Microbulbifer thermotolerans]|uniref:Outer membrane protein assembly factor BamD n=1 Tax=Microbulbifer thermotolerans TaxID=252514 RepID=A0A143HJJ4_MICTH|nr:outer membrane protein assembly factor BamD [Microbulbifer thermotolerans]AMX01650.1 competence protein ComL [Microbulbifer thermotolerans]MCX2780256.1 outer membrane protein assembly factor BamD [Microbulbifer thermotolerans]MCX2783880.1 outer membrane protein assembly factor BamD [Microbulbifer thermotolerans]MCX2795919.1 outer membrane protein assembly factor BamD [Microbulbifer thermotolerans]MCX2802600.1 outer membrane protein assembly factor BamD [Microbulbifer thermotolerans]
MQAGKTLWLTVVKVLLSTILVACASTDESEEGLPSGNRTEQAFYEAAQRQLRSSQWDLAIKNLRALEDNFPFGNYAEQAQLELIYAYYRNYENDAAIAAADRFIRLHPQHRNVDYAYYMKGLASFTEGSGLFERFLPTDMTSRDPGSARESFAHFAQLMARFPESRYAPDAQKRMIHLRNLLARYEIHVANYYFKRGAYLAAANRGRYVVENFQQTPAIPDALAVMVQSYHLLEMPELEASALSVLRTNYPNHPAFLRNGSFNYNYYKGASGRSFIHRITLGLFEKSDPRGFDSRELYNPEYQREEAPLPPELM